MKTRKCLMILSMVSLLGCEENTSTSEKSKGGSKSGSVSSLRDFMSLNIGEPIDYLPTKAGTELNYVIMLGEVEPLRYEEVLWPIGDKLICYATRGRFIAAMKSLEENGPKEFNLKLRVKGNAKKQGGMQFPIGVELEVVEDDLGVYEDAKQVFLAATSIGNFYCHEVITYSPDTPGAPRGSWGYWGGDDGYSRGLYFFGAEPHTAISMGENSPDSLLFKGFAKIPNTNTDALHFVRKVEMADPKEDVPDSIPSSVKGKDDLGASFEEQSYFVRGEGLVYFQQKVNGKISMTWTRSF